MSNTYTQIHLHIIFAVKNRVSLIDPKWKEELYKYITGSVQILGHKMIAINGMPDHLHMCIAMRPFQSLSQLMLNIKAHSSRWINEKRYVKGKFEWQEGYAAFSYSKSQLSVLIRYIFNQESHHKKMVFIDEYKAFLKKFDVPYDEKYLFKIVE